MKIRENITLYECEHCKKRLIKKSAMEFHELWCYSNPENKKACSGCVFAINETVNYYVDSFDGEHEMKSTAIRCVKFDKLMYPFKAEKMGLPDKYPESFEKQEAMPTECEFSKVYFADDIIMESLATDLYKFDRQNNTFEKI